MCYVDDTHSHPIIQINELFILLYVTGTRWVVFTVETGLSIISDIYQIQFRMTKTH